MTADRYELRADHTDWLDVRDQQGYRNTINQPGAVALIRQQARDIDQLRAELAAAVAERSEYWGALHSTKDELFECRANQRTLESDLRITRDQRDTYRARLAAIDAAPVMATVVAHADEGGMWPALDYEDEDLPPIGTHLIARPAKD